jgi:hypothetical protein
MSDSTDLIHHAGLINHDLNASVAAYERLGFFFAPLSEPRIALDAGADAQPIGVGNRHAVFGDNFLEFLGVTNADVWAGIDKAKLGPYDISRPLTRYEGLHVLHFESDDLEAVRARLIADGVAGGEIHPFQRTVETATGPQLMQARAFTFPPQDTPEGLVQVAQHLTPELVFQPRYQNHSNGAVHLSEVTVCAADPAEAAARYAEITGHSVEEAPGHLVVDLGGGRLRFVSPEAVGELIAGAVAPAVPSLVGFTVEVMSLARVREVLEAAEVPFTESTGTIVVDAEYGCGSTVTFEESTQPA